MRRDVAGLGGEEDAEEEDMVVQHKRPSTDALRAPDRKRLHEQLAARLLDYIEISGLSVGDRLPSERDLAQALQVSREAAARRTPADLDAMNAALAEMADDISAGGLGEEASRHGRRRRPAALVRRPAGACRTVRRRELRWAGRGRPLRSPFHPAAFRPAGTTAIRERRGDAP